LADESWPAIAATQESRASIHEVGPNEVIDLSFVFSHPNPTADLTVTALLDSNRNLFDAAMEAELATTTLPPSATLMSSSFSVAAPDEEGQWFLHLQISDGQFARHTTFPLTVVPEPSVLDFNNDSNVDILDIDSLVGEIVAGTNDAVFDFSGEGTVDDADLTQWLSEAATHNGFSEAYLHGDSNLDGSVDATDLNNLALNWRKDVARWSAGDFKPDGVVDSGDLNELALNWHQAISTASTANSPVPEPSALFLMLVGLTLACRRSRFSATP
jgi:hypothetical protein